MSELVDPEAIIATVRSVASSIGDSNEDEALLRASLAEASSYLHSQSWCSGIVERYFGAGIGGVVAVFLFRIAPRPPADPLTWVVVGDLPSAYVDIESASDPIRALEVYCDIMAEWVRAVKEGGSPDGVSPVEVEPTPKHAEMLDSRIDHLRKHVIPGLRLPADQRRLWLVP